MPADEFPDAVRVPELAEATFLGARLVRDGGDDLEAQVRSRLQTGGDGVRGAPLPDHDGPRQAEAAAPHHAVTDDRAAREASIAA